MPALKAEKHALILAAGAPRLPPLAPLPAMKPQSNSAPPDRMTFPLSTQGVNVGTLERAASLFLGGALLLTAFNRRSILSGLAGALFVARGASGHSRLYQWFGLNTAGNEPPKTDGQRAPDAPLPRASKPRQPADPTEVVATITVGRDAAQLYDLWLQPGTMNQILGHVAHIENQDDGAMHWRADLPLGRHLEWTTQISDKKPGERIAWESAPDAALQSHGEVRFRPAPGERGTEVHLHAHFAPPGGALGEAVAKFLDLVPSTAAAKALRNFKALVETGEIPTLKDNVSARGRGDLF